MNKKMKPGWKIDWDKCAQILLFSLYYKGFGLPGLFVGGPGIGKTRRFSLASEALGGFPYESMSPAVRGPGAFAAIPVPVNGYLTFPPADFLKKFYDEGRGLIVIDELTATPPSLQGAVMDLFLEKRLGGNPIGNNVRVLGTANPPDMADNLFELSIAAWNRVMRFEVGSPTGKELAAFRRSIKGGGIGSHDVQEIERAVLTAWESIHPFTAELFERFYDDSDDATIHRQPEPGKEGGPWPSPRSWEVCEAWITGCKVHGADDNLRYHGIRAAVGDVAAARFVAWESTADLPSVEDIITGRARDIDGRSDQIHAVLSACVDGLKDCEVMYKVDNFWNCLLNVSSHHKGTCVDALHALYGHHRNIMSQDVKRRVQQVFLTVFEENGLI